MRKICVVTGTRAEYGLLSRLMRLIDEAEDCRLQVIVTNMHLLPEYGNTYQEIEKDGFRIDAKVLMRKPTDDAYGVIASMAEEMNGMNEALRELCPDMVVILGDRYEMLVAATVAMLQRIPIAHLHGGEISEGAMDDSIRHSHHENELAAFYLYGGVPEACHTIRRTTREGVLCRSYGCGKSKESSIDAQVRVRGFFEFQI